MTDTEITEIIAKRIMGWKFDDQWNVLPQQRHYDANGYGVLADGKIMRVQGYDPRHDKYFSPLTSDEDCMRAWDKLAETKVLHMQVGYSPKHKGQYCECFFGDREGMASFSHSTDRRRAMCECMLKVVAEND